MGRSRLFIGAALGLATALVVGFLIWRNASLHQIKQEGLDLARIGEFPKAEPALKAALTLAPRDEEILRALAKGYLVSGRKDLADESLTRWLEVTPREPEALQLRMELYRGLGQADKALFDIDRLIEIDPENLAWRGKRGDLLYSANRFDEAEKEFEHCRKKGLNDRDLLRRLAAVKRAQGKLTEAGALLDTILRDAPNDSQSLRARALLHFHQEEFGKSIPLFRKVLALNPNPNMQLNGRYYLSLALSRVGETEEAAQLMDEVRRMQDAEILREDSVGQPDNLPLQMRNARAQFDNNDVARTVQILQHVLRNNAGYPPAHLLMAEVFDKQGRFDLAAEHRRRAKEQP